MKQFWDNRYSSASFAYGEKPNEFFKEHLSKLTPGRILLPGDGEGRNGVFAASLGWDVEAFDISSEGKKKAEQLAAKNNLKINYQVGRLEDLEYAPHSFDVIALIFTHFDVDVRVNYRQKFVELLKPGGIIISELFSIKHLEYNSKNPKIGGPNKKDLLASVEQIREEYPGIEIIELEQKEVILNEGVFHVGKGNVVRFLGRKPA